MRLMRVKRIEALIEPADRARATVLWWVTGIDPRRVVVAATATIKWEMKIGGVRIEGEAKASRKQQVC